VFQGGGFTERPLGPRGGPIHPVPFALTRQIPDFQPTHLGPGLPMRTIVLLTAMLVLVAGRLAGQDRTVQSSWPLPTVELPASLDRVLRDYEAAWKSDDGARLAELFLPDGFVLSNGTLPVRGRPTIAAGHTRSGGPLQLVAFAWATGDSVGYVIGGYRYPDTVGPGGKFVLALRKDAAGVWKIAADMDNSSRR